MNKIILILILVILITSFGYSEEPAPWTKIDYALTAGFVIGQIADFGISAHAINNSNKIGEVNSFAYGKNINWSKATRIKLLYIGGGIGVLKICFKEKIPRRIMLYGVNAFTWGPVIYNIVTIIKNGGSLGFSFPIRLEYRF